jgi:hypothetical protein
MLLQTFQYFKHILIYKNNKMLKDLTFLKFNQNVKSQILTLKILGLSFVAHTIDFMLNYYVL